MLGKASNKESRRVRVHPDRTPRRDAHPRHLGHDRHPRLLQRDKAKDSDAKATVNSAATAIESHSTNNGGVYTGATVALLRGIEPTLPDATKLTVTPTATGKGYTVTVKSTTNNTFSINRSDTGVLTYTCTVTGGNASAGCPTSLNWKT